MRTIAPSELIDYHEPCPYCGERALYIEFDEWGQDGTPTSTGTHVHCQNEDENDPRDHAMNPYAYWLPLDHRAHRWAVANIRITDKDDRKELEAWNEGKPLPGGMRQ